MFLSILSSINKLEKIINFLLIKKNMNLKFNN